MTLCEFCHPQLHRLKQQTLTGTYLIVRESK
uniref:Uncharacterized protein n=1 Tax=viral metagenome TaxID=1070528 RepID=A0A6C0IZA4_9ZZZZ